jgi:hypothetical protein
MKKHYLMIKTHTITNLKYLCKKSTNKKTECFSYLGSGVYWKKHLKIHGNHITTEIIDECETKEELIQKGMFWSEKFNVVESEEWANLIPERGDGGPTMLGRKITPEQKIKQKVALQNFWKNASDDYKQKRSNANSKSHEKYRYYTPAGIFTNAFKAAEANMCTNVTIINKCVVDSNKQIESKKYWRFGWRGKTWRELGWYSEVLDT